LDVTVRRPRRDPDRGGRPAVRRAGSPTLAGSAVNGNITVTASDNFFKSTHVGGLFQLTSHDFISGRAGRVEGLRVLIESILERGDVAFINKTGVALAMSTTRALA
jgi:hypothetical protein